MNWSSITGILAFSIFTVLVSCKDVDGVFTAINYIRYNSNYVDATSYLNGGPMSFYDTELSWLIDTSKVNTGDYFYLNMPYVFEIRILEGTRVTNNFDILMDNGQTLASCTVDQAGGRSLETVVKCQVTANLDDYQSLSGTVGFLTVFDGGTRVETIEAANHWKSGSNVVTFNGDISRSVSFSNSETDQNQYFSRITMRGDTNYYFAPPKSVCRNAGIRSGTFQFSINQPYYTIVKDDSQLYYTTSLNSFGFPTDAHPVQIQSTTLSRDGLTLTITFGSVPAGARLWWSGYTLNTASYVSYQSEITLDAECVSGYTPTVKLSRTHTPIQGSAGGDGSGVSKYHSFTLLALNATILTVRLQTNR